MNECYHKLLDAVQAECEKNRTCFECKYRNLCEIMEEALAEFEQAKLKE